MAVVLAAVVVTAADLAADGVAVVTVVGLVGAQKDSQHC